MPVIGTNPQTVSGPFVIGSSAPPVTPGGGSGAQAGGWRWQYEGPGGDTSTGTLPLLDLEWRRATITRRRRAPDELTLEVPFTGLPGGRLEDFTAFRELRLYREGTLWLSGFLGAPTVPDGEAGQSIVLPGWGNALALLFGRNVPPLGASYARFNVTSGPLISSLVGLPMHGATAWFPPALTQADTGAITHTRFVLSGRSVLEAVNELCAMEGWEWRVGPDFSFRAGLLETWDPSPTITLYSPANCTITSHEADALALATNVTAAARVPDLSTTIRQTSLSGTTSLLVQETRGFIKDDQVDVIAAGGGVQTHTVLRVAGPGELVLTTVLGSTADVGERVVLNKAQLYATSLAAAPNAIIQAHHAHHLMVANDQLRDPATRAAHAAAVVAARGRVPNQVGVTITDQAVVDQCIAGNLRPGHRVTLTSARLPYAATQLIVQEMTLALAPDAPPRLTLALGDPLADALAVLEARTAAGHAAATTVAE